MVFPKRRETLESLRAGGILVADRHFFHYIDGWQVSPQNFYRLVQHRLIRVLDPTRDSEGQCNVHVIAEKGLALRASLEGRSEASQLMQVGRVTQVREHRQWQVRPPVRRSVG